MGLLDFILNVAGVLMWMSWRAQNLDPLRTRQPATLAGTVRPTDPKRKARMPMLLLMAMLLFIRAVFYYGIGGPAGWTAKLDLGLVVLPFRSDGFGSMTLFSFLSFLRVLAIYYTWVWTLIFLTPKAAEGDPILKLLRAQLGLVARVPWFLAVLLMVIIITATWIGLHPLLARLEAVTLTKGWDRLIGQGLLLSLMLLLSLKYLLCALLIIHLIFSYVYLGTSQVWDFTEAASQSLLSVFRSVRLSVRKVDLKPFVALFGVLLLLHWGPQLVRNLAQSWGVSTWPQ